MSRPESITDLPYEKRCVPVVTIHPVSASTLDSEGLHELAELREVLDSSHTLMPFRVDDGEAVYVRDVTEAEAKHVLAGEQAIWDSRRSWYERAAAGEYVESWRRPLLDAHAAAEGLDPVDWDAMDASEAAEGGDVR
nr:hypothetical protein [Actinomyces sp.]